ncbi:Hypothetical protein SCF082_LOCUS50567 [Durusdinium trenchii]|uniref:tRNA (adenine(58)-N(1))-methyltransferase non-catalytic subunit TRM6 n=1 Tax=Durusdinium trenchii TaxID=1381693 RepID=A0ABP0S8P3_9DINO
MHLQDEPVESPQWKARNLQARMTRIMKRREDFKSLEAPGREHFCFQVRAWGLAGPVDGLLMVADDDAELTQEVLELSLPRLAYGGRVAMFGHHLQPLAALQGAWRANGSFVDVRLTQLFTREFQALPSRTHPFMVAEAQLCEGFILCASKVVGEEPRNDEPPSKKICT